MKQKQSLFWKTLHLVRQSNKRAALYGTEKEEETKHCYFSQQFDFSGHFNDL